MGRLDGKVALITGGASGLGKATGQLMAKEGATVVLSDLQEVEGTAVSKQIKENGGHCFFIKQDTTSEEGWQDICDSILENHGHLDILLNGAGVGSSAVEIEDMDFSTWRNCLSVNLDGVFLGCKYGIRAMRKGNGGSIINISSILGFAGLATATNYCASKGGVRLLTKAAALECARKTPLVRVNSIHPGFIDTPMVAGAIQRRGPEFRNYIEENVPLGELGEPNDIAEGVVYLASDGAKFVTGTELTIDGGFLAR
ncbi:MAG: glucose 1-dehydrogenase [Nisaea sp.]|nr:glucose 1-dehydrogenase [Nisaea sp.]MED5225876.1 glucose 1-dehydrogenase [Pseudomonadota bacterium]